MRRTTRVALAAGAVGAWVAAARDAGLFLHGDHTAAVPGEPGLDDWSQRKRYLDVGARTLAYVDEGSGDPVLLLHGCPFHALEWQHVIPRLAGHYRVLASDLPGLGDTPVRLDEDYRLPQIAQTIVGFLDTLGIDCAHVVGHDHGGATALLLMDGHADRFRSLVLTNAEAYDHWPSQPERKYLRLVVNPLTSPLFKQALRVPAIRREVLSIAVHDPATLTGALAAALIRAHTATPHAGSGCGGSSAGSLTPTTTGSPPRPSPPCAGSTAPRCCCGAATTPTSGPRWPSGWPATSPVPLGCTTWSAPPTCPCSRNRPPTPTRCWRSSPRPRPAAPPRPRWQPPPSTAPAPDRSPGMPPTHQPTPAGHRPRRTLWSKPSVHGLGGCDLPHHRPPAHTSLAARTQG
jgi:pimeloyl-ACP methyl ester carboxylesterase